MSRRCRWSLLLVMVLWGCERQQKARPPRESAQVVVVAPARPPETRAASTWDSMTLGPVVLVARESPNVAFVITPGSSSEEVRLGGSHARLIGRSGTVQDAILDTPSVTPEGTCPA